MPCGVRKGPYGVRKGAYGVRKDPFVVRKGTAIMWPGWSRDTPPPAGDEALRVLKNARKTKLPATARSFAKCREFS